MKQLDLRQTFPPINSCYPNTEAYNEHSTLVVFYFVIYILCFCFFLLDIVDPELVGSMWASVLLKALVAGLITSPSKWCSLLGDGRLRACFFDFPCERKLERLNMVWEIFSEVEKIVEADKKIRIRCIVNVLCVAAKSF